MENLKELLESYTFSVKEFQEVKKLEPLFSNAFVEKLGYDISRYVTEHFLSYSQAAKAKRIDKKIFIETVKKFIWGLFNRKEISEIIEGMAKDFSVLGQGYLFGKPEVKE
ncbi:hypothetical protein [Desulfurobacterium sp.]